MTYSKDDKHNKRRIIPSPHTVVDPLTMMIACVYAIITCFAMDGTGWSVRFAGCAVFDADAGYEEKFKL